MCEIIINRSEKEIIETAQIAIDAELYMPFEYCHIRKFLTQAIENNSPKIIYGAGDWLKGEIVKLIIAYENKIPAGICLLIRRKDHYIIEIFVKECFRRRGIGYNLIQEAKSRISKTIYVFKSCSWKEMDFITDQGIKVFRRENI